MLFKILTEIEENHFILKESLNTDFKWRFLEKPGKKPKPLIQLEFKTHLLKYLDLLNLKYQ